MVLDSFFQHFLLKKDEFENDDPRIAIIALSFYLINADGTENKSEYAKLNDTLKDVYTLDDAEVKQLLAQAQIAYKNALDMSIFSDTLKIKFSEEENIAFIRFLYDLAYCDDHVYELEDNVIWRIANMLEVSDKDLQQQKDNAAIAKRAQI